MKIAILHDDFPPEHGGGAGMVAFSIARGYGELGHEVLVIAATQDASRVGRSTYEGLAVERIYSNYDPRLRGYFRLYNPKPVQQARALLKNFRPDIVHAHNVHTHLSYYSLIAAKKLGAKVFMTAHDVMPFYHRKLTEFIDFSSTAIPTSFEYRVSLWPQIRELKWRYNPLRNFFVRRMLARIDGVIAVSDALRQALEQNGIPICGVVPNCIKIEEWVHPPANLSAFKTAHELQNKRVILFVGAQTLFKGWPQTLAAMEKVRETVPEALLVVAGRFKEAHAPVFVRSLGWLSGDDLKAAFYAAEVVLQPSLCLETFGLTSLEAMAAGRPVIGTCFGGVPEVVQDTVTGYIVNPIDTEGFAKRISELLSNPDLAHAMGAAGQKRAREQFSLEQQAARYLAIFDSK